MEEATLYLRNLLLGLSVKQLANYTLLFHILHKFQQVMAKPILVSLLGKIRIVARNLCQSLTLTVVSDIVINIIAYLDDTMSDRRTPK